MRHDCIVLILIFWGQLSDIGNNCILGNQFVVARYILQLVSSSICDQIHQKVHLAYILLTKLRFLHYLTEDLTSCTGKIPFVKTEVQ